MSFRIIRSEQPLTDRWRDIPVEARGTTNLGLSLRPLQDEGFRLEPRRSLAALLAEPGLRSLQIGVDTKNATVTLSGSVDTAASKERAKEVAGGVAGVASVVDQLTVKS